MPARHRPVLLAALLAAAPLLSPPAPASATPGAPAPAPASAPTAAPATADDTSSCDRGDTTPAALRARYAGPPSTWPAPCVAEGVAWVELGPLPVPEAPADNPTTPERVAIGRRLFHDPRLSGSGQIACASCHDRDLGWADGRRVAFGHDRTAGRRNAPSVRFAAFHRHLFWDGRASTLEQQALAPMVDPTEMAADLHAVVARLADEGDYAADARAAFGRDALTIEDIAKGLAAFQRSLGQGFGRFEAFVKGRSASLDDQQLRGLHLFRTEARCMSCHHGPAFTDQGFHNLGLHFFGRPTQDLGRFGVTGDPADRGAFRTPTLRGVADTAPYMHRGYFGHLRGLLAFYNAGGVQPRARAGEDPAEVPVTSPLLRPLGLSREDLDDLEAFLGTL